MSENAWIKAGSPPWDSSGSYRLPETVPVFIRYPDGKRIVGWPGSWPYRLSGPSA